jgi:hypothetical protein
MDLLWSLSFCSDWLSISFDAASRASIRPSILRWYWTPASTAVIPTGKADGQLVLGVLELVKEEDAKIMQPKRGHIITDNHIHPYLVQHY